MTRLPKIFLALSVAVFVVSLTEVGSSIAYGLLKPMSAIFFMLFFLVNLLAKETALYDAEQRACLELAKRGLAPAPASRNDSSPEPHPTSALTAAHSH